MLSFVYQIKAIKVENTFGSRKIHFYCIFYAVAFCTLMEFRICLTSVFITTVAVFAPFRLFLNVDTLRYICRYYGNILLVMETETFQFYKIHYRRLQPQQIQLFGLCIYTFVFQHLNAIVLIQTLRIPQILYDHLPIY